MSYKFYAGDRVRLRETKESPEQLGIAMSSEFDDKLLVEITSPPEYSGGVEVPLSEVELVSGRGSGDGS